jgi:hypothetical protein
MRARERENGTKRAKRIMMIRETESEREREELFK